METIVRQAEPHDTLALRACVDAAFSPYTERIGTLPAPMRLDFAAHVRDRHVWVAVGTDASAAIVGVLVQYETPEGFYIDTVASHPCARGAGVGRALLVFAEREAARRGFDSLYLCTNSKMFENQVLYPKVGYVEYARKQLGGYDRIYYRKPLGRAPRSGAIEIVDARAEWPTEFAILRDRLSSALGPLALRIEHVGSTSVAGLAAKDVIDVQVSVASLDAQVAQALTGAGFRAVAEITGDHVPPGGSASADAWAKLFFTEPAGTRRANIHVRRAGSANERYALLFRDYLRAHPPVAAAYAQLKRRLATSLAACADYADVKDPAVDLIYLAAEQWAAGAR